MFFSLSTLSEIFLIYMYLISVYYLLFFYYSHRSATLHTIALKKSFIHYQQIHVQHNNTCLEYKYIYVIRRRKQNYRKMIF